MNPTITDTAPSRLGSTTRSTGPRKKSAALWAGRVASVLGLAFLAFDTVIKLFELPMAVKAMGELGYPPNVLLPLAVLELVMLLLYAIPKTALFAAVLWSGYLGGAIATHVRLQHPLFSHVLFPIYVALLLWGGLYLRRPALKALLFSSHDSSR